MGLDQYLSAKLFFSGYDFTPDDERARYAAAVELTGLKPDAVCSDSPYVRIEVSVGYWRKANAIHRWFVENVQDGNDDCGEYYVSREQLEQLRDLCRRVLREADIAPGQPVHSGTVYKAGQPEPEQRFTEGRAILNGKHIATILPTTSGFFFGSTDYDEWYLQDIEATIEIVERALALPDRCGLHYSSSW